MSVRQAIEDAIAAHLKTQFADVDKTTVHSFARFYSDDVIVEAERVQNLIIVTYMNDSVNEGTQIRPLGQQMNFVVTMFHKGGKDRSGLYELIDKVTTALNTFTYHQRKINYVKSEALPMPIGNGVFLAETAYALPLLDFPQT